MGQVARLSCCACRRRGLAKHPVEVHHIREGTGAARRASDFDTIPLCEDCHRGAEGIHGKGAKAWRKLMGASELELVHETRSRVRINLAMDVARWMTEVPEFLADSEQPQIWPLVRPLSWRPRDAAACSSPTPAPSTALCS